MSVDDVVSRLRSFNRFYTQRLGLLTDRYLGQGRPVAEARVLFEIGPGGISIRELRRALGLDSGYLSRVLRALERDGLVEIAASGGDRRLRLVRPTDAGREELHEMEQRANAATNDLVDQLDSTERGRFVDAVDTIERLLRVSGSRDHDAVRLRAAVRADAPAIAALLSKVFDEQRSQFSDDAFAGSTPDADAIADRIGRHGVWVVEWDSRIVGTVTAEIRSRSGWIRSLAVVPDARGLRIADRLIDATEGYAVDHDLTALELDTTAFQTAATKVYRRRGFRRVGRHDVLGTEMIRMRKPLAE